MSLAIGEHMTSESALSWRRGYRRFSSHEDDFAVQPRGKDTPLLPVPLSVTSTPTFSFRLFIHGSAVANTLHEETLSKLRCPGRI